MSATYGPIDARRGQAAQLTGTEQPNTNQNPLWVVAFGMAYLFVSMALVLSFG